MTTTYTRAEWDARPARSGPGPLEAARVDGIALHWPGIAKPIHGPGPIAAALRGWQDLHMNARGWSDIAYQVAVDQNGNRWQLRGLATQSAANGDTDVNQRFGAVLLILATGEHPTAAMLEETRRVVEDFRGRFPRGRRIVGHRDIRPEPTACPGPITEALIKQHTFEPQETDMISDADLERIADAVWSEGHAGKAIYNHITQIVEDGLKDIKAELKEDQS